MARFVLSIGSLKTPVGSQFVELAERLRDDGHDVVVVWFGFHEGPSPTDIPGRRGGSLTVVPWPSVHPSKMRDALFFFRLLRKFRPHCVTAQFASVNWALTLSWIARVPVRIAWYHTLVEQSRLDSTSGGSIDKLRIARRRFVYARATKIVSVSRIGLSDLDATYGVAPHRCVVIPNGIHDPGPRHEGSTVERKVLSGGRLVPSKGHDVLLRAYARLAGRAGSRLVISGTGPGRDELLRLARELSVEDSVDFVGQLDHDGFLRQLRTAAVFALPSMCDNVPVVLLEAMGAGVPIVATSVGGIPELVEDGREGLLVDAGDVNQFAEALDRVLTDHDLRERLGANGRHRFLATFENRKWIDAVSTFLVDEVQRSTSALDPSA